MQYFYLGYFAPGCRAFDYKLDIAKSALEYFDICSEKWVPIADWDPVFTSIKESRQKLTDLQQCFNRKNIESHLIRYNYFHANLIKEFKSFNLFDYIEFVYFFEFDQNSFNPVIVYDIRDRQYHLLNCFSIGMPEELKDEKSNFSAHLLKIQETIYSTPNAKEMSELIPSVLLQIAKR